MGVVIEVAEKITAEMLEAMQHQPATRIACQRRFFETSLTRLIGALGTRTRSGPARCQELSPASYGPMLQQFVVAHHVRFVIAEKVGRSRWQAFLGPIFGPGVEVGGIDLVPGFTIEMVDSDRTVGAAAATC